MKRQEKAERIGRLLDELYPQESIEPPLTHHDAYSLLVAVMLSAQTTDERVNLVTPALFELASTPAQMMNVEEEAVLEAISSVNFAPTKAKRIRALSRIIEEEYGGQIPQDSALLERLPGVGHKTASVVMTQWFGVPAFPVDTHIHRLAGRWGLSRAKSVEQTEYDLKRVFPEEEWNRRHLQIIFFGREHCPARGHDLSTCPICSWAATKKRIREESPPKTTRRGRAA